MGLTLTDRFGTHAVIDITNTADPLLTIHLKDFKNSADGGDITNSQGITDISVITPTTKDVWADRIAAALLILWKQTQPTANSDDSIGLYVEDPAKNFVTRNTQPQLEFSYPVGIYAPDTTGVIVPDDVV